DHHLVPVVRRANCQAAHAVTGSNQDPDEFRESVLDLLPGLSMLFNQPRVSAIGASFRPAAEERSSRWLRLAVSSTISTRRRAAGLACKPSYPWLGPAPAGPLTRIGAGSRPAGAGSRRSREYQVNWCLWR